MARVYGTISIDFEDDSVTPERVEALKDALNDKWLDWEIQFDDIAASVGIETNSMHPILLEDLEII